MFSTLGYNLVEGLPNKHGALVRFLLHLGDGGWGGRIKANFLLPLKL